MTYRYYDGDKFIAEYELNDDYDAYEKMIELETAFAMSNKRSNISYRKEQDNG